MSVLGGQFRFGRSPVLSVAGTFEKVDTRYRGKSRQLVHGEDERPLDEPMHDEPVLGRIDRRNPCMVALVMQAVRRDDAVEILKRRQAERRQARRRRRQPVAIAAHDIGFELGRPPVRVAQRLLAGFKLPFRDRRRQVPVFFSERLAGGDRPSRRAQAHRDEASTGDDAPSPLQPAGTIAPIGRFGRSRPHGDLGDGTYIISGSTVLPRRSVVLGLRGRQDLSAAATDSAPAPSSPSRRAGRPLPPCPRRRLTFERPI